MFSIRDADYRNELARLTPNLRRLARALVDHGDAEAADDLVQATLLAALRSEQNKGGGSLNPWLVSLLVGLNRDQIRVQSAEKSFAARGGRPGQTGVWAVPAVAVRRGRPSPLDGIPLDCREVLLLVTLEGFSYSQTAEALGMTLNTVMEKLSRARAISSAASGEVHQAGVTTGPDQPRRPVPYLRVVRS